MSRRKQQNPKPLVALKQAEDEPAEKPSGCEEAGSMMKGELLLEEAGERDGGDLLSHADESCVGGGGGNGGSGERSSTGSPLPSPSAVSAAAADTLDSGGRVEAANVETEFDIPQDIIRVVRIKGEHRVLSQAHIAAGSGCGPFRARHVPRELAEQWLQQRPTIDEELNARLLKFYCRDSERWFLLETNEGQWLRFLDRADQGQAANVAIHFIDNTLWLAVTQHLKPDDALIAELGRLPPTVESSSPPLPADQSLLPQQPQPGTTGVRSDQGGTATPAAAEGSQDDASERSAEVARGASHQAPGEWADAIISARPSLLAAVGAIAGDRPSRPGVLGPVSPLTCRACGVTFRSQRTLEAHETYYCSKASADSAGAAAAAAAASAASQTGLTGTDGALREDARRSPVDVKPPSLSTLMMRRMPAVPLPEPDEHTMAEVFQCQICKLVTRSWSEMRAHARNHAQPLVQPALTSAAVSTTSPPGRSDRGRQTTPTTSSSYCSSCDIRFMSVENYDIHRQHYCGSRRGRAPFTSSTGSGGADAAAATTASPVTTSLSRSPSPHPPPPPLLSSLHHNRKAAARYAAAGDAAGGSHLWGFGTGGNGSIEPTAVRWSLADDRDPSQLVVHGSGGGVAQWLYRDAGLLRLAVAAAARPNDSFSASRGSGSPPEMAPSVPRTSSPANGGPTDAAMTISIPAVLSVPAPIADGSIACSRRGSLPGRLIIGSTQTPISSAAGDASSVSLEVPASIVQRAVAVSQLQQQERRTEHQNSDMTPVTEKTASPAPRAHRDGPLDLSMKCLKRKLSPPTDVAAGNAEQHRPAKAVATSIGAAAPVAAAPRLPLTPKTHLGHHGSPSAATALLSKCVECNILFYKHENYVAHKTHYCPARHKNAVTLPAAAHDNGETSSSSSSAGSARMDKQEFLMAVAAAAASAADRIQMQLAPQPPSSYETSSGRQPAATGTPELPETVDDASREGVAADELHDDRLVITYMCNKCGGSFTELSHFKAHACRRGAVTAATDGTTAAATTSPYCRCCGGSDDGPHQCSGRFSAGPAGGDSTPVEPASSLLGMAGGGFLRRGGASGGLAAVVGTYVCSICGYHGNTVRGMRLHGRYHIDHGEMWSEACIVESGLPRNSGAAISIASPASALLTAGSTTPLSGLLLQQQQHRQSPNAEEELLRLKNEPYKKRKSRKSYQLLYSTALAMASSPVASCAATNDVSALGTCNMETSHDGGGAGTSSMADLCDGSQASAASAPATTARPETPPALDTMSPPAGEAAATVWPRAEHSPAAAEDGFGVRVGGGEAVAAPAGDPQPVPPQSASSVSAAAADVLAGSDGSFAADAPKMSALAAAAAMAIRVKVEPNVDEASTASPAGAHGGNGLSSNIESGGNENRRSLSTPQKRHVCAHCNVGFMYPSSFDAHVKFYCPSSRAAAAAAGVAVTGN